MKKRVLCFGDSNTWGAIAGVQERYDDGIRWTSVLQETLGGEYQVIEEGHCGRTSNHDDPIENRIAGIKYFGACIDSQSPLDLIILMLGTNDLKTRYGLEAEAISWGFKNYKWVLDITPMMGNKPKVLLCAPILVDPSYKNNVPFHGIFGEDADVRSQALAPAFKRFADENGWEFFDAAEYASASPVDGIHIKEEDHPVLGRAIAAKVKEILG